LATRIAQTRLTLDSKSREIKEITSDVARWVEEQGVGCGLLTVYIPHTSASLLSGEPISRETRLRLGHARPKRR
jgi:thiamine phosphate synthase YjbQ (UPF0047 family)